MVTFPREILCCFADLSNFETIKNFSLVSKECNSIITSSPRYIVHLLSTFYTGKQPYDESIYVRLQNIFIDIANSYVVLEKPITIQGKQVQHLSDLIKGKDIQRLIALKLLLKDIEDVNSITKNESLLPLVQSLEFSDNPVYESGNSSEDPAPDEESRDEEQRRCDEGFTSLLKKMPSIQELIFHDTEIDITEIMTDVFTPIEPYSSVKELQLRDTYRVVRCYNTERVLKLFPNVEKICISGLENFSDRFFGQSIAKDSKVKELFFFDSSISFEDFKNLLICIPTVESIVFHQPFKIERLLSEIENSESIAPSVTELCIFQPKYRKVEDKTKYGEIPLTTECVLQKISKQFPNLKNEALKITVSENT